MNSSFQQQTISATEACAFEFPSSQGKNYRKTDFILHSRVAELIADQLGHVFYNDDNDVWSIGAGNLRGLVLTNVLQEDNGRLDDDVSSSSSKLYSRYPIYGSAIAFEPNVWTKTLGLDDGVTYPATSKACLEDESYCSTSNNIPALLLSDLPIGIMHHWQPHYGNNSQLTELNTNSDEKTIYCPYGFRGPPDEIVYENCSRSQPEFCPSMDLAYAYDYSNVTVKEAEWYTAPRCLYLRDGIRSGYWSSPYFDDGAGEINMVTYSQPIISSSGKFLGITTIDITVDALCYGDQCKAPPPPPVDYNYLTNIRPVGLTFFAIALVASVGCGIWMQVHRKDPVVVASQPFFLQLICVGCLIMASSIIPLSIDDGIVSPEGCSIACMAIPWLLSIGFTATFAALFSKIWRLNIVMHNASRMRRVKVMEKDVILPFAILLTLNCALMLGWTLVDPLVWVRTAPNDAHQSQGYCRTEGESYIYFLIPIGILNALALVLANVQAFRARHVSTEFSESLYIMMAMVSLLQTCLIGVPLLVLVRDNAVARYFIWSGLIFVVTMAILCLMFLPKMVLVRRRARDGTATQRTSVLVQNTMDGRRAGTNNIADGRRTGTEQAPGV